MKVKKKWNNARPGGSYEFTDRNTRLLSFSQPNLFNEADVMGVNVEGYIQQRKWQNMKSVAVSGPR